MGAIQPLSIIFWWLCVTQSLFSQSNAHQRASESHEAPRMSYSDSSFSNHHTLWMCLCVITADFAFEFDFIIHSCPSFKWSVPM